MTKKHQVFRQLDSVTDKAAEYINYFEDLEVSTQ